MNETQEIQAKIDRFMSLINDEKSTAEEIEKYKKGVEKLKAMLPPEKKVDKPIEKKVEKPAEKKEDKKEEKKPAEKKSAEKKSEKKEDEKVEKPAEKKVVKGMKIISSKKVLIDGKEVDTDSKEFCDYLAVQFQERRKKAQENKGKRKKTESVMAKVSGSIEKGVISAIKTGIDKNTTSISKNPKAFIGKIEKLESATKTFMQNLKDVLGSEYDAKEVTSTTKAIQEMIEELKKKYAK